MGVTDSGGGEYTHGVGSVCVGCTPSVVMVVDVMSRDGCGDEDGSVEHGCDRHWSVSVGYVLSVVLS
jgi:hypothetical protein